MNKAIFIAAAAIAFSVPSAFAQSTTTNTAPNNPPTIADRKENQQDRIAQGVQSGELTSGETKRLETGEAALNKEEHTMRQEDNGHLTAADRAKLNNQQNHLSNHIYADKHNAAAQHYGNSEVGKREENQQDRIAQGIKSGQLTPAESARLEKQQQGLNREVNGMREANGGKLTPHEKALVNHQQNHASANIHAKKHNRRVQ